MEKVIRQSYQRGLALLTEHLLEALLPRVPDAGLVIVPTLALAAVPWGALPGLRGRPVIVAPSATAWSSARRAMRATVTRPGRVLLVAGPRLDHADAEVEALSAIYPDADRLGGSAATVAATLGCLEGATLAHFATHGRHEADNALFSRLDLVDGPLMAYDLQTISAAPRQVVLAACDVGQAVVRPGDELLGFTAALLQAGSGAVVASVARVPDEAARHQTVAYHRALVAGAEPAQALADAMAATDETPAFVCFGAG